MVDAPFQESGATTHVCTYQMFIVTLSKQLFSCEKIKGWIGRRPILLMKRHGSQIVVFVAFWSAKLLAIIRKIYTSSC